MKKGMFLLLMVTLLSQATTLKRNGWNLISVCQEMNRSQIDMTGIKEIQNQRGQSIYTGEFSSFSNLEQLEAGYGYWVKGDSGTQFDSGRAEGALLQPLRRDGWNLMASCEDRPTSEMNRTSFEEIQNQDGLSLYTGEFASNSNLETLEYGYGYWVKGTEGTLFSAKEGNVTLTIKRGSLVDYLNQMTFGSEADNVWKSVEHQQQAEVQKIVADILNKNYVQANQKAQALAGKVIKLTDVNRSYYILHLGLENLENTHYRAVGGTYVFNPKGKNLAIEVPHPSFDSKTNLEGIEAFVALDSRYLLLSGTHRKSSDINSTCQSSYKESDASHNEVHYFHQVHTVLSEWNSKTLFVQLHGFGSSTRSTLWNQCDETQNVKLLNLSEGVDDLDSSSFMHLFHQEITSNTDIKSCLYSPSSDNNRSDIYTSSLGGTTNTQGRFSNGVASNVCGTSATGSLHRFLHLEQSYEVRSNERAIIIDALKVAYRNYKNIELASRYGIATQGGSPSYQYYEEASLAIDNNNSTYNHTEGTAKNNWWQLELPKGTTLSRIMVKGRNSNISRLNGAKVYLLEEPYAGTLDERKLLTTLEGTSSEQSFTLPLNAVGHYLLIKASGTNNLHMLTVEAYGTLPDTPRFSKFDDEYFVREASTNDTVVTRIEAEDFQGDRLAYSIEGDVPFSINDDGEILVNGRLDYGIYTFDVVVSDGTNRNRQSIRIKTNRLGVPQNIAHAFGVATQNSNTSYQYYKDPANAIDNNLSTMNMTADAGWLQVALPTGTKVSKIVVRNRTNSWASSRLNGTKLYLGTKDFNGTLIEEDYIGTLTGSEALQIFIFETLKEGDYVLLKENDDNLHVLEVEVYGITPPTPVLQKEQYTLGLQPYSAIGTIVGKIEALDYQEDSLVYSLVGDVPFSIDGNGTIKLLKEINHNLTQAYTFNIEVSDGENKATASVTVKLLNGNGVKQERWNGILGTSMSSFLDDAHYQDAPDEVKTVSNLDMNSNLSNNFGQKMSTILKPIESGSYIFAIVGDDETELRLDGKKIAYRSSWTSYQNWAGAGKSKTIELEAGNIYSLEAFLKESGGAEHVSVGWKKVGDTDFTLIPENQLFLGVLDSETVKPIFEAHPNEYLIQGTTALDTVVARVSANDLQGDELTYSLIGDVPFSIDSNGDVRVNGAFSALSYTFEIEVSDGSNTVKTPLTINITSSTAIADVLASGDVVNTKVTEEELIQATLEEIEATKTFLQEAKAKIFNLNSDGTAKSDGSSLTSIDWTPTHDASVMLPTEGRNSTFLYSNAVEADNYTIEHKPIGILGEKGTARYMVFGGNPFRNSINAEMNQVLENSLAWLTQRQDLNSSTFNVVIAHLDESYWFKDESKTRAWLDTHYSGQVNYNSENSCDNSNLSSCLDNNTDVLIISQVSSSEDDIDAIASTVNHALSNGISVLYIHHDGDLKTLGRKLFSSVLDVHYAWDNYWHKLKLEAYNPTVDMNILADNLKKIKTMFTHLKNKDYDFDWSVCKDGDKVGSQYDNCSDVLGLNSEFQEGATATRTILNALDNAKKNIFLENSYYRLPKLLALTADKFRQSVSYPMDKVTTDNNEFMKSYYADHAIYNYRTINPKQLDMGNFSRSDFSHISPTTRRVQINSKRSFRATGAYALPGQTVRVTRNDDSNLTVKVFINTLRSGATHQYQKNGYNRPKYLQTPHFKIKSGETIALTSPYGGAIQLQFSKNDLPVDVTFENVGEHAFWASSADNASFTQKLDAKEYDWAEIATAGFEVHSKLDKMIQSVEDTRWGGTAEGLANAVVKYTSNYPHVLAGFKGEGVDVVSEIHDWANERNITIETIDIMKHMNADQATCGYGCSGNPYDAYWAFDPIGHGDIHEMGHSMQKMRFEGFENHAATNTFSYYTKARYFDITGGEPDCQGLPFKSVFDTVQSSVRENNITEFLKINLWDKAGWQQPYVLKINAMMHAQKLGKLENGWHVLARVHILEREMRRAKQDWEARKALVGFSIYSLDEINAIRNNDWLIVAYSYASELDLRNYFDMMGIPYSQKAREQIASFNFEVVPNALFVSSNEGYCKEDDYGRIFDRPTLPIDGVTPYTY